MVARSNPVSVLPGRIATPRARQINEAAAARSGIPVADVEQSSTGEIPAGRYGEPDGFGAVAAFLCSAPASYVTGAALRCDGGLVAQSLKIFFNAESASRLSKLQSGFSHSAGNTDNGTVVRYPAKPTATSSSSHDEVVRG